MSFQLVPISAQRQKLTPNLIIGPRLQEQKVGQTCFAQILWRRVEKAAENLLGEPDETATCFMCRAK